MNSGFLNNVMQYTWLQKVKQLLGDSLVEVGIGALIVGSIFGGMRYRSDSSKAGEIPLAFSEIEHNTRDLHRLGQPVPPLTRYYSVVNDVPMKVFESNNIAREHSAGNTAFARELETRRDRALRVYPLISEYAPELPKDADAALQSLHKIVDAATELPAVTSEFSSAWDENHHDVTHTHTWTTTECDADGKNCHDEEHSEEVYDYTIHTYNYYPEHGESAARLLDAFLKNHPDLNVEERLHLAASTQADNEYAIEKSRRSELDGKRLSAEEYLALSNTWATGSTLTKYLPVIVSHHASLAELSPVWNAAKGTAQSDEYRTYSHSDDGPGEFQVANSASEEGQTIYNAARKIIDGIQFAREGVPALDAKIKEYISVVLDKKPGDANELRSEVMQLATDIYQKNFENGFDVEPFKWLNVVLFTLLGAGVGAAAGGGVAYCRNKRTNRSYSY
ncbi:MAG: hypothetical protein HY052_03250 [Proteobacteria bacterium]|nr:hypothetical protein [Pseudomonadota bacterium]